jgi:transcriptional regulator with XRE-family HTH domain
MTRTRRPFGRHLHDRRIALGWSKHQLAVRIGAGDSSISEWEAGTHIPRPRWVQVLESAFGLSGGQLESVAQTERESYDRRTRSAPSHARQIMQTQSLIASMKRLARADAHTSTDHEASRATIAQADDLLRSLTTDLRANTSIAPGVLDSAARAVDVLIDASRAGERLRRGYAELLAAQSRYSDALEQWSTIVRVEQRSLPAERDTDPLLHAGIELVNLGEYAEARAAFESVADALVATAENSWASRPELPEERAVMRARAIEYLAWIDDYEGHPNSAISRCQVLIGSDERPGIACLDLEVHGGTEHRWGRTLVEHGLRLTQAGRRGGEDLIELGAQKLKHSEALIRQSDRRAGRALNPYGPVWNARAALAGDKLDGRQRVRTLDELEQSSGQLFAHVVYIKARDRRLRGERVSAGDLQRSSEALEHWRQSSYKHGGCDLLLEYGHQLASCGQKEQAGEAWLVCQALGEYLHHPALASVQESLGQLGISAKTPAARERSEQLIASPEYSGFFSRHEL